MVNRNHRNLWKNRNPKKALYSFHQLGILSLCFAGTLFLFFLFSCSSTSQEKPEESNEVKNQAAEYTEFGNRFFYKAQYSQALSFFEMALEEKLKNL